MQMVESHISKVSIGSAHTLSYIPVWVKEHEPVAAHQVQATATSLGGEQERKLVLIWVIEAIYQALQRMRV